MMKHTAHDVEVPVTGSAWRRQWFGWAIPDPSLGLEARLFQWIALVYACGAVLFVIPANYLQGMPLRLNLAVGVFAAVVFWIWWQARQGHQDPATLFVSYSTTLSIAWFFNEGSSGSCLMYFMLALTIPVIFNRGWVRVWLIFLYFADIALLFWLEQQYPHWIVPYPSALARMADLWISLIVSTSALALIVWVVLSGYLEERARLIEVNARLKSSLDEVKTLQGLLPVCSWCRKVRDDEGLWTQIEQYVSTHTGAEFTHGMCPECYERGLQEVGRMPGRTAGD